MPGRMYLGKKAVCPVILAGGDVSSVNGKTGDVVLNAQDVRALPDSTSYGAGLEVSEDLNTHTINLQLKDQNGNDVGQSQTVNMPTTYIHEQGTASATWTINHNLHKFPSVSIVDSAGNEIIAEVSYPDQDTCVVTMTGASKGKAYLN